MPAENSQARMLVGVMVLVVASSVYLQIAGLFRDQSRWQLSEIGTGTLWLITIALPLAVAAGCKVAASKRPITVLLCAVTGGLGAALVSPLAGTAWGLLVGIVAAYPLSAAVKASCQIVFFVVVLSAGCLGVGLSRRIYIDAEKLWWTGWLLLCVIACTQTTALVVLAIRTVRSDSSWRRKLPTAGFATVVLIAIPVSWFAGWHGELLRRVAAIQVGGGLVSFEPSPLWADFLSLLDSRELQWHELPAALSNAPDVERRQLFRDILYGAPAGRVELHHPTPQDLRTLSAFQAVEQLSISGKEIDDVALAGIRLPSVTSLELQGTGVSGEFLGDATVFPTLRFAAIRSSPFSNRGISFLAKRPLHQIALTETAVTSSGFQQLKTLPQWPFVESDVPFGLTDVSFLVEQLESSDERARVWAAFEVGKIGPTAAAALPSMVAMLQTDSLRDNVIWPLANMGPQSIPLLIAGLEGQDASGRRGILWALGAVRPPAVEAVPVLIASLQDKDAQVRMAAARSLATIGTADAETSAVKALISDLQDADVLRWEPLLREAICTLGEVGPAAADAVPGLVSLLAREDDVGWDAADALAKIGDEEGVRAALQVLLPAMGSNDTNQRARAISSLGLIGPRAASAVPSLFDALADDEDSIRIEAAKALVMINDSHLMPVLTQVVSDPGVLFYSLLTVGDAAIPTLIAALATQEQEMRDVAGTTLRYMANQWPEKKQRIVDGLRALSSPAEDELSQLAQTILSEIDPAAAILP